MKVVILVSQGLDSKLAWAWCQRVGFECLPLYISHPFIQRKNLISTDKGVEVCNLNREFLEIIKNPKYGFGKYMNPCIDCRILMLKKAKEYMESTGASFVVTGEVLGQRPMSQFLKTLIVIDKSANLEGRVLRPLSGRLLPLTEMEKEGIIDRNQLLDIQGRSRRRQLQLAHEWGIKKFLSPSGGCLLTDRNFVDRLRKELKFKKELSVRDIELLKIGRHYWIDGVKIIIGRNNEENNIIERLAQNGEILLRVLNFGSPVTLFNGKEELLLKAAQMTKRYSDGKNEEGVVVEYKIVGQGEVRRFSV
ncbi:MAG: tRNA 4-thiouridine(8) synthase ThiI [candidate division WOR-3 bacterium]